MKKTSKFLVVLMLVVLAVVALVTNSFAAIGTGNVKTGVSPSGTKMKFSDYSGVNFIVRDSYEGGDLGSTGGSTGRGAAHAVTVKGDGKGAPYIYDLDSTAKTSTGYVYLDYTKNDSKVYLEPMYTELSKAVDNASRTPYNGYIMEFDIATQATADNTWSEKLQIMNSHSWAGGGLNIGVIKANNGKVTIEGISPIGTETAVRSVTAASVGGWVHITLVYNPAEAVITMYANQAAVDRTGSVTRKCIAQISNYDTTNKVSVYPMGARMCRQAQTTGDFCLDNVMFYQATVPCDPQYMNNLTPQESFVGNVSLATDTAIAAPARYAAYDKVRSEYINTYCNGSTYTSAANTAELKAAVDSFNAIDAAALKSLAMTYNVNELESKVTALKNLKRGFSSLDARAAQITEIEAFITSTATLIDKDNAKYATAIGAFDTWKLYYQDDVSIRTFINRMNRFGTAPTAAAMQRHYDEATELYSAASAVESKLSDANTYPVATERTNISNAITAYKNAGTKLAAKVKEGNAERFVNLVNKFADTTKTDWEADDGTIRNLWYLARKILLENNYTATTGFTTAKTNIYDPVNAFFSEKMQEEHVAVLQAKLAVFEAADSNYVDKAGVCKYVDNYLDRNSADIVTDADIEAIKAKNAEYKTLLASLEIDYTSQLIANTVEFVDQMTNIATFTDYKNLKPLFDKATDNYYNMNLIGNEGAGLDTAAVQSAVRAYEALKIRLLNVEVYSTLFVAQMADIPSESDKDDYYAAFMNCFACEEYLDVTYEGVADCKGRYDTMKTKYLAKIDLANTESRSTVDSVCSVRVFCGIDDLVNHIQRLLK